MRERKRRESERNNSTVGFRLKGVVNFGYFAFSYRDISKLTKQIYQ